MKFNQDLLRQTFQESITKDPTIICEDEKMELFIRNWCESCDCEYEDFTKVLEFTGIKATNPALLHMSENGTILCAAENGKEVEIVELLKRTYEHSASIWIKEGGSIKKYSVREPIAFCGKLPEVVLSGTKLEKDGKWLDGSFFYSQYYVKVLLEKGTYELQIELNVHKGESSKEEKARYEKLQNYCLSLNSSINVTQVYDAIIELMQMNEDDIKESRKILISFKKLIPKEQVLGKILKFYGKVEECTVMEQGGTYSIFANGNWSYRYQEKEAIVLVNYYKAENRYAFSVAGEMEKLACKTPEETISILKPKILDLWNNISCEN